MPDPVTHTSVGYLVYSLLRRCPVGSQGLVAASLFVLVITNLADIDFLPGLLIGQASVFHRGFMHSFSTAFIISVLAGLIMKKTKSGFLNMFLLGFLLYAAHLALDFFTVDDTFSNGIGIPLFWPFIVNKFIAPVTPLVNFKFQTGVYMLGKTLFFHNAIVLIRQVLLFSVIAVILYRLRKKERTV